MNCRQGQRETPGKQVITRKYASSCLPILSQDLCFCLSWFNSRDVCVEVIGTRIGPIPVELCLYDKQVMSVGLDREQVTGRLRVISIQLADVMGLLIILSYLKSTLLGNTLEYGFVYGFF